jgi:uncharacterized protein YajQ (UPF0234 family)
MLLVPSRPLPTACVYDLRMPSFDIVSELDMQEVRNAVDQANREAATRFDFKNTNATIEIGDKELRLSASTEDRLRALALKAGITQDVGKKINKMVKDMGVKNLSSSIQGDQVRVTGKQRDDLQQAIAFFKQSDLDVPLQFTNFRD